MHERRYQQMCHICAKVFTTKQTMLAHLREHSGVEVPRVNCEFCGKLFKTSKFLRTHVKNMHEQDGKVYECAQCQKQFAVKHALKGHIAYHHNFKLQECNICDKKCKTAGKLKVSSVQLGDSLNQFPMNVYVFWYRNTWRYTQESIYTHAIIVQERSRPMQINTHTANECIRMNGVPLEEQNT